MILHWPNNAKCTVQQWRWRKNYKWNDYKFIHSRILLQTLSVLINSSCFAISLFPLFVLCRELNKPNESERKAADSIIHFYNFSVLCARKTCAGRHRINFNCYVASSWYYWELWLEQMRFGLTFNAHFMCFAFGCLFSISAR